MKKIYVTIKNTPIFLRLSLIIIVVFIFISVSFFITSKNYREERLTSIYNIVNQNNHQNLSKIDDYIEDIANITKIPLTYKQLDKNYMNFLYEFSINGTNSYDFQRLNEQIFEEIFTYKESVNSCFIFNLAGVGDYKVRHAIYQPFNPSSEPWFSDCLNAFGKPVLIDTYELPNIVNDKLKPYYVFGIARGIVRLQDASVVGILLVNTDISFFKNICENMMLTDNHRVIILHDGYTIYDTISENISMPASEEINSIPVNTGNNMFSLTIDDESMFAASLVSDKSNWQIISLIPESELFYELNLIQNQNIEMIIIAITISLILLFLISRQIVNPIQRLSKVMKIAESGDFHAHVQVDRMDETGMLAVSYNSLLDKINELIEEVYMQQISSSKLELQMLQSQINPHFLYNTLESISMMATLHDDEITAEMSATLGDILRYSISNLNQPVTLNDEITQMKKYISLLERRFHSQYRIDINIDLKYYTTAMPKLTLQPIVENAIYHGMSSVRSGGEIKITADKIDHDTLLLTVSDNGNGMTEEEVLNLNGYVNGENELFQSIGIKNVNRRIQLFCGQEYGVTITSVLHEGTTVYVRIRA